jgi:hypothetical protein
MSLRQLAQLLHIALRLTTVPPLIIFQLSCAPVETTPDATAPLHLKLSRPVHFSSIDGQDVVLEAGLYHIKVSGTSELHVTGVASQTGVHVRAEPTTHLESIENAVALTVPTGEDELHLLLLRPDKTGLEAVGTYSGVQSRGPSFGPATQLQISQATAAQVQLAGAPLPPLLESPPPDQTLTTPRVMFVWRAPIGQPSQTHYELCLTEAGRSCAEGATYRWIEDAQRVAVPGNVLSSTSTGTPITGTRYEITIPPMLQSKPLEWLVRACAPGLLKPVVGGTPRIICTASAPRRIIWAFTPPNLSRIAQYQSPFRPVFDWSSVPAAESYLFCISRPGVACPSQPTDTAQTVVVSTDRYTTQYTPANDWELVRFAGHPAHWTAAACSIATGCVYRNIVESLTLQPPPPSMTPNLDQPQSGLRTLGRRVGFKWTNVPNIQRYKLCVAPPGVECGTSGSYEQFVFASTSAPDISIPDRLTPDGTQTTLNWTVAACQTAERCAYQPMFRTITVSNLPQIRMVVLGDSVEWGQGLEEHKKFHTLIAERVSALARVPISKEILAHSGANIGWNDAGTGPSLHGEIPTSYPTIRQQLFSVSNPHTVDLVLLNGCINDLNVRNILNPASYNKTTLQLNISTYCHDHMKELLRNAGQRFPSANIVVTGYYPMLSTETDLTGVAAALIGFGVVASPAFLSALGLPAAVLSTPGALPALAAALIAAGVVKDDILDRAKTFHDESKKALRDAVTQTGIELGSSQRYIFADAGYGRANAMFTAEDHSWLYALTLPGLSAEDAGTPPEQARRRECTGDLFICHRASIGHPNEIGAQNYANAVISKLSARQLNPAQP